MEDGSDDDEVMNCRDNEDLDAGGGGGLGPTDKPRCWNANKKQK